MAKQIQKDSMKTPRFAFAHDKKLSGAIARILKDVDPPRRARDQRRKDK